MNFNLISKISSKHSVESNFYKEFERFETLQL